MSLEKTECYGLCIDVPSKAHAITGGEFWRWLKYDVWIKGVDNGNLTSGVSGINQQFYSLEEV